MASEADYGLVSSKNTFNIHTEKALHNIKQSVVSRYDQKITFKVSCLSDPEC